MRIATLVSQGQRNKGYSVPAELVGAGFETEVVETSLPVFPHTQLELKLMELSTIQGGLAAAAAGFDAVFINTVGDYGLDALRCALRIPVVGAGQAAMQLASGLGRRFAIVTIWPETLGYLYDGLLAGYGFADACVAVRHVGQEDELASLDDDENFVTRMRGGEDRMLHRIVAEMRAAIAGDGAEVIVLGCTCMAPVADRLAAAVEVPVVNPLTAGYKMTELQLSLRLAHSAAAWRTAGEPRHEEFRALIEAAQPFHADGVAACRPCSLAALAGAADD